MNARQLSFHRQARSDWSVFRHFHPTTTGWRKKVQAWWRGLSRAWPYPFAPCHELHYLQMCAEKLAKAYYPAAYPRSGHKAFRRFLTHLPANPAAITPLRFADLAALMRWQGSVTAIVGAIEDLAPAIADGLGLPNPEYPWPRGAEVHAPVDYSFETEVFAHFATQAQSGEPPFLTVLGRMVDTMQSARWHL